jgi:hypothetical protein
MGFRTHSLAFARGLLFGIQYIFWTKQKLKGGILIFTTESGVFCANNVKV